MTHKLSWSYPEAILQYSRFLKAFDSKWSNARLNQYRDYKLHLEKLLLASISQFLARMNPMVRGQQCVRCESKKVEENTILMECCNDIMSEILTLLTLQHYQLFLDNLRIRQVFLFPSTKLIDVKNIPWNTWCHSFHRRFLPS